MPEKISRESMIELARSFCVVESQSDHAELYGVTDGKAVGTFMEHRFQALVLEKYDISGGSSAKGIDLPGINTDIKVTSIKQPQSSCPFKSARQKIYGLSYDLLLFVYDKKDDAARRASRLTFVCCALIEQRRTADFQTTRGLLNILKQEGNHDDIIGYLTERNLPADEITLNQLEDEILKNPPEQGYLTMSNALQWRLQYGRIVALEKSMDGIEKIL